MLLSHLSDTDALETDSHGFKQIWVALLQPVLQEMAFIARSGDWPEAISDVQQEYLKYLSLPTADRKEPAGVKAKEAYERMYRQFGEKGQVEEEVWHAQLLRDLDAVYRKHVAGVISDHFMTDSEEWRECMVEYWDAAERLMLLSWSSQKAHCVWTGLTQRTLAQAPARLAWVRQLRALGQQFDVPLATQGFLQDVYQLFAETSYGLQWVSTVHALVMSHCLALQCIDCFAQKYANGFIRR